MEQFVRNELESYLNSCLSEFDSSCIDDVVISYLMSVLTDLPQGDTTGNDECSLESLDTEQVIELLSAYIPELSQVERPSLCDWLLQLSKQCCSSSTIIQDKPQALQKKKGQTNLSALFDACQVTTDTGKDASTDNASKTDGELKEFVVSRFAYTEQTEGKEHHPVLRQKDTKKMVRYRDNKVVSTKGERYIVETKKDQENDEMKKTYINLKPLRKYRFH